MKTKNNLVWIDLEMTGLNPEQDVILEIATVITNNNLDVITQGPSLIIHHTIDQLNTMQKWAKQQHTQSGLIESIQKSQITTIQAEQETLAIIQKYCESGTALLCGNSVWQDKAFLQKHMPKITDFLHYRIIDVTTIKEIVIRWYPNNNNTLFEKKETHRAQDDIYESIAELQYYKKNFFII